MVDLLEATEAHALEVASNLRRCDRWEGLRCGVRPWDGVMWSWRTGLVRRAALVDGRVAAMWGASGTALSGKGQPWFLTTAVLEEIPPLLFARLYKAEVQDMRKLFPFLENFVDSSYTSAVRMMKIAGFNVDEPQPVGRRGAMLRRFWVGAV